MSNEPDHESELEVREMELDDLPAVFHLGERLFTSEDLPILYRTWDPYEVVEPFTSGPEFCLIAEDENERIVGFILGTTYEKEGTAWKYGYISWLGVAPEVQRRGLGERLCRAVERRMREEGVRMMLVDTEAGNLPAVAFFKRLGFTSRRSHVWLGKTLKPSKSRKLANPPTSRPATHPKRRPLVDRARRP